MSQTSTPMPRQAVISSRTTPEVRSKLEDLTRHFAAEFRAQITLTQTLERVICEAWDKYLAEDGAGRQQGG